MTDPAPYCDDGCQGFSNERFRETGELRDQWLAACGRPAKRIFDATDRWSLERDLWQMTHP